MRPPTALVHVAGRPQADALQRCVGCGTVIMDNTGWALATEAILGDGDAIGPGWWPDGALVATERSPDGEASAYVIEQGIPLDDDEQPCVTR